MNQYFYEIFEALPRQGPGDRASTERALALLPPIAAGHRVLDIGCGSGAQTLDLARATDAHIVAVDNHPPFIQQLEKRVAELGLGERVTPQIGDMGDLQFPDAAFDVVWSEGASFIIGFGEALSRWRRLLRPGGHMVISELWLHDDAPAELREFCAPEGSDVGDFAARKRAIDAAGYQLLGDFVLPTAIWWESYYGPLTECVARFRARYVGNEEALAMAARSEHELELYRKYSDKYGYAFFAMRRE